jgi:hypothetical protein
MRYRLEILAEHLVVVEAFGVEKIVNRLPSPKGRTRETIPRAAADHDASRASVKNGRSVLGQNWKAPFSRRHETLPAFAHDVLIIIRTKAAGQKQEPPNGDGVVSADCSGRASTGPETGFGRTVVGRADAPLVGVVNTRRWRGVAT